MRDDTSSNEDQNGSKGEKDTSDKEDLSDNDTGGSEEEEEAQQESLSTSVYELVSLNDVPSEAKEDQCEKKAEEAKEEEDEKKENDDSSMSPVDGDSSVHEEVGEAENNDEIVEKIELIGDDKTVLSDSIIIVEKDPEERRITRGYLNTEQELVKEDKSEKSHILDDSDFNESEDDSPNMTPVPNKSDAEMSGNENNSKLNDSFKVDLRPSWMKTNFGERN